MGTGFPSRQTHAFARRSCLNNNAGRFQAKWKPVRVKETRQNKRVEAGFNSIKTEMAPETALAAIGAHTRTVQIACA
jgi:hypothetical protein